MIRREFVLQYAILGAGIAGIGYYSICRFNSGTREDQIKLGIVAALSSGIGFLGAKYIRLSSIEHHDDTDAIDKALVHVRKHVEKVKGTIKDSVDKKTEEMWMTIREKYVTEPMRDAFDCLNSILGKLREFGDLENSNFQTPMLILLALVKKVQDRTNSSMLRTLPKESQVCSYLFQLHQAVSFYAVKIYDASWASNKERQAAILGLPTEEQVIYTRFQDIDDDHCPKFAIVDDQVLDAIVIVIRGTFSLTDVFIDIVCDDEEFLEGCAHKGILRGMFKILGEATHVIKKALEDRKYKKLYLTGHSLGAGTAELMTMELLSNPGKYVPEDTFIQCVALAPPPIFRSEDPLPQHITDSIHIYINSEDCIPRLSLGSVATLLAILRKVDAIPLTNYQKFQILSGLADNNPEVRANLDILENTIHNVEQDHFPFLDHPGTIHYLYKEESSSQRLLVVRERSVSFSKRIMLLNRMILDHFHFVYLDALKRAIFSE